MKKLVAILLLLTPAPLWAQTGTTHAFWSQEDASNTEAQILALTCSSTVHNRYKFQASDTGRVWRCDGTAWVQWPRSAAVALVATQAGHGFSAGQWIMYNDATEAWQLLDVSSRATMDNVHMAAFVVATSGDEFTAAIAGNVTYTHGLGSGPVYGSATPGAATATSPALGTISWQLAVTTGANEFIITPRQWWQQ